MKNNERFRYSFNYEDNEMTITDTKTLFELGDDNLKNIANLLNAQAEQIRSLEEQLKNAIVPKFKIGQTTWYVSLTNNICEFKIKELVYTQCNDCRKMITYCDEQCGEMYEYELSATREEAEKRLAELEGK